MEEDIKELDYENYDPNIFKNDINSYRTELKPTLEYIKQVGTFVAKELGITKIEGMRKVKDSLKDFKVRNPLVKFRRRQENGDTIEDHLSLTDYIKDSIDNKEVLVPSFTSYFNPEVKKSLHSEFLNINVKLRKSDKHNEFKYKQLGNADLSKYYNIMQKVRKVANNSLSGAYASKSTILNNPSAHYTLTSITRSVASIGNAVSESIVAGNKHFRSPDIVLNYIISVITTIDMIKVGICCRKFNLYLPTPVDTLDCLLFSSRNYWTDPEAEQMILDRLTVMDGYERAAICYVNDLFHMKKFNNDLVKEMIDNLSNKVTYGSLDPLRDLNIAPEGINILTNHIWMEEIKGMSVGDYSGLKETHPELLLGLGSTTRNILLTLEKYRLVFKSFFTTEIMPISIAYIRDLLRDCIVLSDTDSTCGSYDKWVEWYFGEVIYTPQSFAVSAAVMTINTQVMDHHLKTFSRNMNVPVDKSELIKMKNEFTWSVFTPSNVSKHYDAFVIIQEGNVYKKPDRELKGVHYIASSVEQSVVVRGKQMIDDINTKISNGELIELSKYVTLAADIERELIDKIKRGDPSIFKRDKIKNEKSYKQSKEKSTYFHHLLWKEVFETKYGESGDPIYLTVKVPTVINSKKDMTDYLDNLEDTDLRDRLKACMARYGKEIISTFRPPAVIVNDSGLPEEIVKAIDIKRIVFDNMNMIYLKLETIGFYRKFNRMVSEMGY